MTPTLKLARLLVPAAAAGLAAALLLPAESEAFTLIGGSLGLGQRDVRVFNNFTDPAANNNTTQDPEFPGYDGVELAIWKAVAEWGSEPHGTGGGDPLQATIGSGGANFDATWQGNAEGVGGPNDNICSQLNGSGGGVYAFVETPISNGWRMRFLRDPWNWQDGPDDEDGGSNRTDIQGIATHEYGHSLGLGHTNVAGATMFGSTSPAGSSNARSIAPDDIAGVRAIYGVASPNKPRITDVEVFAQRVRVTGERFHPSANEVWFTRGLPGGNGQPVTVVNVRSTNGGTVIEIDVPAEAGDGDVLVRVPGGGGQALSNAFPFDLDVTAFEFFCTLGDNATFFCPCGNTGNGTGGCENAEGTGGARTDVLVFFPNGPSATVRCTGLPNNALVVMLRSATRLSTVAPFGDGVRCLATPVTRLSARPAQSGVSLHPFGHGVGPGTYHYQPWYRSSPASFCNQGAAFNLGSGVSIEWP